MYPRMDLALSKSYFSGKEFNILLEEMEPDAEEVREEADINKFYPELLAAFARGNREQLEEVLQGIVRALLEGRTRPQKAKMEMIRLLQRIEDYCVRCGVPESWIRAAQRRSHDQDPVMRLCGGYADLFSGVL